MSILLSSRLGSDFSFVGNDIRVWGLFIFYFGIESRVMWIM